MNLRKYLSNVRDYDADDVLDLIGLQKKSGGDWVFPMLAGLGAGMAIGAGLAFFLTPYKGEEMRQKVIRGASDAKGYLTDQVGKISEKVGMTGSSDMGGNGNVTAARTMNVGGTGTGIGGTGRGY